MGSAVPRKCPPPAVSSQWHTPYMTSSDSPEPNTIELRRAAEVLGRFVEPWGLSLNPENLELMAYCVLKYGRQGDLGVSDLHEAVDAEIQADAEGHSRMQDAMRDAGENNEGRSGASSE